jgi:hypothetical protein
MGSVTREIAGVADGIAVFEARSIFQYDRREPPLLSGHVR